MSETFDYHAFQRNPSNRHSLLAWFFIHAICNAGKADGVGVPVSDDGKYVVSLSVNGVALPFVETIRDLEAEMERSIAERAQGLAQEQLGVDAIQDMLSDLARDFDVKARAKLGLEPRRDHDD